MRKRIIALSVSLLLVFGLLSGCRKPETGLSQVVIGTMSVIETATRGEDNYDMLFSTRFWQAMKQMTAKPGHLLFWKG